MYLSRASYASRKILRGRNEYIDNVGPPFIAPEASDKPLVVYLGVSTTVGAYSLSFNNILINIMPYIYL